MPAIETYSSNLERLGLNRSEIKILIYLYQQGPSNATNISAAVKIQRPNVYDLLKSLEYKGMLIRYVENNAVLYRGISGAQLVEQAEFAQSQYTENLAKIKELAAHLEKIALAQENVQVLLYRGFKGARNILSESLEETKKTKKEILGIGVRNERFFLEDPIYYQRYINNRMKMNAKSRYLLAKGEKTYIHKKTKVRVLPHIENNPTATYIYGETVSLWLWFQEPIIIVVKNKDICEAYRKYFEHLWARSNK